MIREENIRLIFGLKIKYLRQEKSVSLSEVAKKTAISISYLNEIEKGKKYPKVEKVGALANYFGVTYDWLISLQLPNKLAPIGELLRSNILQELPLEIFGLEPSGLLDLLSAAPAKVSAFISTLIQMTRSYDVRVGQFYFSALRSYQEMYENYFPELEAEAEQFKKEFCKEENVQDDFLRDLLEQKYHYTIEEEELTQKKYLNSLRSLLAFHEEKPTLHINKHLSKKQRAFIYAREVGFNYMELRERPYTSTWVEVNSFEEVLNNFKASYFASALMIPEMEFVSDCKHFFQQKTLDQGFFIQLLDKYHATPEMLMQRLTNVLPRHFGLKKLYFLRINNRIDSADFNITKELHLSGKHNPHASALSEHYCRRWLSIRLIDALKQQQLAGSFKRPMFKAQVSTYYKSETKYLVMSLARPVYPISGENSSISIGVLLDSQTKKKIKFLKDENLDAQYVGVICESCPAKDCQERIAPEVRLKQSAYQQEMRLAILKMQQKSEK